jgi:hypothetical protein
VDSLAADCLAAIPAWSQVPAVASGKVVPWDPEPPLTYEATAAFVRRIAELIT